MAEPRHDWTQAALNIVDALYPAKEAGDPSCLFDALIEAIAGHARAEAVELLQLKDHLSVHRLASTPRLALPERVTPDWLTRYATMSEPQVERLDGDALRVVLPLVREYFGGVLVLLISADTASESGFDAFLRVIWREAREVVRLGELAGLMDEWRTRSTAVLDTIPQSVIFIDNSGKRSWINAAGAALLGIVKAQHVPQVIAEAMARLRESTANADEIRRTGANMFSSPNQSLHDWKWVFGDPITRLLNVTSVPLASSSVKGRLWVFDDITHLHRATEELLELNGQLASKRQEAENQSRAKSEFLANMSHEIRTPLNSVLGLVQLLSRESLTDNQRDMVGGIQTAGQFLMHILNDILDLSKIEAGQMSLLLRPFDLGALLARLQSLLGQTAHTKGVDLRVHAPPQSLRGFLGDELRLEQILFNLIGNAIKFTEQGEVEVTIVPLEIGDDSARLRFEVRDTGIGIAEENLDNLFEIFSQAEQGITRRFGGSGLGLSICKRLVELMGGIIGVESKLDRGSLFWFELTLSRDDRAVQPAITPVPPQPVRDHQPRLKGLRCLVVDDSAMNRDLLERTLQAEGAYVVTVNDGQQAVDRLRREPEAFDAVLMDVRMPVMDGLTATRLIREELDLRRLPVLALTAGVLAQELQAATEAGVNDVLPKPLDLEKLIAALHRLTGVHAAPVPETLTDPDALAEQAILVFPVIEGIDRHSLVRSMGLNLDLFRRQLRAFCETFADIESITQSELQQGKQESAVRRLHTLKGNAGNLGAMDIMALAAELEIRLESGEEPIGRLALLQMRINDLITASTPWLAEIEHAGLVSDILPAVPETTQLEALRVALRQRDLDAVDIFENLRPALRAHWDEAMVEELGQAVESLRFEAALALLD